MAPADGAFYYHARMSLSHVIPDLIGHLYYEILMRAEVEGSKGPEDLSTPGAV